MTRTDFEWVPGTSFERAYGLASQDWVSTLVKNDPAARGTILAIEKLIVSTGSEHHATLIANVLSSLSLDTTAVLAGALFVAVRSGEVELADIANPSIEKLVSSLDRIASATAIADNGALTQARNFGNHAKNVRRMLIALIDDPRVAVLKLVERMVALHLARDLPVEYRQRVATEALEFYCPLASRLGIWQLKWQLEDLSFAYLRPDDYRKIVSGLKERRELREKQVAAVCEDLRWRLNHAGMDATVSGRAKNIYSIWRKMQEKHISFDAVYDVEGVRVIVNTVSECYAVLGVVHTSWPPIPDAFDDYIANPKNNGYSSLHTAVIGPRGRNLEVQIRTDNMHHESELGVCAHWAYKGDDDTFNVGRVDWMREVLHWQEQMHSDSPFTDLELRNDVPQSIYVSTPKGHVIDLPSGSTAVDFAYRIHTDIGNQCTGVNVDGVPQPLNRALITGQTVEIITSPDAEPQRRWLDQDLGYIHSSRARKSVQEWFRHELDSISIDAGKAWLKAECERLKIRVDSAKIAEQHNYESAEAMYIAIAIGEQAVKDLIPTSLIEQADIDVQAAVGRRDDSFTLIRNVEVSAQDRPRLLLDITWELALMSINVLGAQAEAPTPGESATIRLTIEIADWETARQVVNRLRAVPGVENVTLGEPA